MKFFRRILLIAVLAILMGIIVGGYLIYIKKYNPLIKVEENKSLEEGNQIVIPKDLIQCTEEILKQDCEKINPKTVCGYEYVIYENGEKRNNVLEFKSACHYCRFYGLEEKEIGGTKIKGLGYEENPCDQGMYKNK